jgi:ribosomal protein S18 acetylase RimI-like enzyme
MLEIKPMMAADKAAIILILKDTPEFEPEEVVIAVELIDYYLSDGLSSGYHVYVAQRQSEIVGYICYGPTPLTRGTWDIYWIAVKSDKKGQGIGKALMEFAEEKITAEFGRLSIVETSSKPSYELTRQFYQARGYDVICRITDFYSIGDDKIIFQKRINL